MRKNTRARKKAVAVVDSNLLYARAKAKQVRAHAALEREIGRLATQLEKLVLKRNASLQRLARFIVAEIGPIDDVSGAVPVVTE
jgi:hypothetical protein